MGYRTVSAMFDVGAPQVHCDSDHPFHAPLYKTLVLLRAGDVYFVIQGLAMNDAPDPNDHERYFYDMHTCPSNYIQGCEAIVRAGDFDPHGCFDYVRAIWMPKDYADADAAHRDESKNEMLARLFPELLAL